MGKPIGLISEADIQQSIQIEGPFHGVQLLRNNSGAFTDASGRHVRFGLGNVSKKHSDKIKSSDLIGFRRIVITPEMVGKTLAVIAAIEVKEPGWQRNLKDARENAQDAFMCWIRAAGGFAGFASSIAEFRKIIGV